MPRAESRWCLAQFVAAAHILELSREVRCAAMATSGMLSAARKKRGFNVSCPAFGGKESAADRHFLSPNGPIRSCRNGESKCPMEVEMPTVPETCINKV